MASIIKVDKLDPQSGTALEIGTSGDTVTVPTGAGLTVVDEVKTNKISPATGTAFTLGDSGDTFTVPSGATFVNSGTATGFAAIAWQSVVTGATLTAVAGRGYPINTTSNACTVTLPASASVGDQIIFSDYLRTWGTNAVTINQNSLKYQGNATPNPEYDTDGESLHIVYMDATQGWIPLYDGAVANETLQSYDAEYLVVGGGGSSGNEVIVSAYCGGAGAGGYRTNYGDTAIALVPSTVYTMTVGTGGAAVSTTVVGNNGVNSTITGSGFSTITATGGGGSAGGGSSPLTNAASGGSGGGSSSGVSGGDAGAGNAGGDGGAPSIPEGFTGEKSSSGTIGGAGGGAGEAGGTDGVGYGGDGLSNSITGSAVTYGGGGSGCVAASGSVIPGGDGGGGVGGKYNNQLTPGDGEDGKGGGAGGISGNSTNYSKGGDGVIILRVATSSVGTPSGHASSATDGSDTVITWNATGSYTA